MELAEVLRPYLDAGFRAEVSARAPETVESYRWPKVLERYERVLEENAR
jgi:hypothetical protein